MDRIIKVGSCVQAINDDKVNMIVVRIEPSPNHGDNIFTCEWFDQNNKKQSASFRLEALKPCDKEPTSEEMIKLAQSVAGFRS